ncbi:YppE family protein [Sutcliffiella rhizosphaerae]|uniref:DUF1798 family protein n=1 Tax=Sutcliffiella rhizosphaerae TaxID=2880967 RepID=A0ABM8YRJ0_9BACI|nr:YppE family protein [Sutcliffiella rhizosphaerae]CAG9622609.1 hypothetical protein BACCIP111883_03400 [Sutcliffiella rhizosphaerae]
MTSKHKNVEVLSTNILSYLNTIESTYVETAKEKGEPDFFETVKPFADKVFDLVQRWEEETKSWIKEANPKNIHVQQVDSTVENINMISVQCFYPDTREKRFKGMLQSIRYVLNDVITKLDV